MAEQQPLFTPLDALRGEPVDEQLALFGTSRLLVIAEQGVEIPVRQFGQHGPDDGGPVQLHRQVLPQLDALIVLVADHPFVGGIRRSPDPGAMTHPGRQQTPSLGLGVGTGDGAHRHPQPVSQGPVGRQSGLGGQCAIGNGLLDGLDQFQVEGPLEGGEVGRPDCHGDNKSIDPILSPI
ncbi:hypothetical protein D3C79_686240 [compost metagenome]